MRKKAPLKEKQIGVAKIYAPLRDTVTTPLGIALFDDLTVHYRLKGANGRLGAEVIKTYTTRHAVRIIYGRLKADTGEYLLVLVQRIQQDQQLADMRKQRIALHDKTLCKQSAKKDNHENNSV